MNDLLEQMVAAGQTAISPALEEAYAKTDAEIGPLGKLWELVHHDTAPLPTNRPRALEMFKRLQRPVLTDIAVVVLQAIDDAAGKASHYEINSDLLQHLPIHREDLAQRMGLTPGVLTIVLNAMVSKLTWLVQQQELVITIDGKKTTLTPPVDFLHRLEEAIKALESAAENPFLADNLAKLYISTGKHQQAVALCGKYAERAEAERLLEPAAGLWRSHGAALEAIHDLPAACRSYEHALQIDSSDVSLMERLGRIYRERGDFENAKRVYSTLLHVATVEDSRPDAFLAIRDIHLQLGHAPEAQETLQYGLDAIPGNEKLLGALVAAEHLLQRSDVEQRSNRLNESGDSRKKSPSRPS